MRRQLLLLLFCFTSLMGFSQESKSYNITLWMTDGTTTVYALQDKPVLTFTSEALTVSCKGMDSDVPLSELIKYTFEDYVPDGISGLPSAEQVGISGGSVTLKAGCSALTVSVLTLDGKTVMSETVEAGSSSVISLGSLNRGVYIIKANNTTYKILKK